MIIQCEKCHTKFNIDEALIKKSDSKARCSRCKHVFKPQLHREIETEEKPTESAIEEALLEDDQSTDADLDDEWDFDEDFEEDGMEDIEGLEAAYGDDLNGVFDETLEKGVLEVSEEQAKEEHKVKPLAAKPAPDIGKPAKYNRTTLSLLIVLVILVFVVLGYAVYRWGGQLFSDLLTLPSTKKSEVQSVVDVGGSRLEILATEGAFVKSQKLGRLYVIRGRVVNHYPQSRSYLRVKGRILDVAGKVIEEKVVYAGNSLGEKKLSMLTMEEIDQAMNNISGIDNSNVDVAPETSVDFAIVFESLPENANEYEVGPVSSSSADQETVSGP